MRAPLPIGPPLHLERPGQTARHLEPFVLPKRLERLREVLGQRTRHLTVLLELLHDPHNMSACLRSCEAFGLQDLHVVPQPETGLELNPEVTTGSERWLSIHRHATTSAALDHLRAAGYRILATTVTREPPVCPLGAVDVETPLCVAFGNERDGVSAELTAGADATMQIPMHGFVESLNVSVAFAVTIHELRRRLDAALGPAHLLALPERHALLDRWMIREVPRASLVLAELARRAALSGAVPSD